MSDVFIYSTLSQDTAYAFWEQPAEKGGIPFLKDRITIKGGSGVANKHLVTPRGVVTRISEEDYARLKEHRVFQRHLTGGFLKMDEKKRDPEKVMAEGMTEKDKSAPLTPDDFSSDAAKPQSNKKK